MRPLDSAKVERARKVLERVRREWLRRPGVTGADVGLRERRGELLDEVVIRVHVSSKKALRELPPTEVFPDEREGVPVDVLEVPSGDVASP